MDQFASMAQYSRPQQGLNGNMWPDAGMSSAYVWVLFACVHVFAFI